MEKNRKRKKRFRGFFGIPRTCLLLAGCLLFAQGVSYASSNAQSRLDIRMSNATLTDVLRHIERNSDYSVLYRSDQVGGVGGIDVQMSNATVREVLEKCLRGTGFTYSISDMTVVISKAEASQAPATPAMIEVRGIVITTKREPLVGAVVMVPGTQYAAITNNGGEFSLKVPSGTRTVSASFLGYVPREVTISGNEYLTIALEQDVAQIDEVVVNGYFERRKEGFAGSVTTIKKEDIRKFSSGNIFTTISNLDAGFRMLEDNVAGSNPNKLPEFVIRGKGSFQNGSTSPIFILDGFEVNAEKVFDMDVNRIETITLLKDASATILYGSRAANGVIVIETVPPTPGELRVTYDFKPTISIADLTGYDLMNAREKLEYEVLAGEYDEKSGLYETYTAQEEYYKRYKNVIEGVDTYWLKKPVRNTFSQDHSLSVEGGAESILYGINASYRNQRGTMKGSGRDRIGLDFTLTYRIRDKIVLRNVISYAHTDARNSPYGSYSQYALLNPYERTEDENGQLLPTLLDGSANPLYNASLPFRDGTKSQEFREQFHLDWIINQDLRLRSKVGIVKGNGETEVYISPFDSRYVFRQALDDNSYGFLPTEERGQMTVVNAHNLGVEGDITLNYNKLLGGKHLIYAGVGAQIQTSKQHSSGFSVTGFPDDRFIDPGFAMQYMKNTVPQTSESHTRSIGFFGNLNYIYDNRFFLDFSARYDGSSQFGDENKFAPFWSVGGGWNINNEKFFPESAHIDLLKIRLSYGTSGNQEFSAYQAKTMFGFRTDRQYNTLMPAILLGYGNPFLKWQKSKQANIGLDFGLIQRRLNLTVNFYEKRTESTLTDITVAPQLGFAGNSYKANLGKIKNTGYEFNINGVILRKPENELEWAVNIQAAHNKNKLLEISNQLKSMNDQNNLETRIPGNVYEEGESMTAIKAVRSLGIDPVTGQEIFVKKDGTLTYDWNADDKVVCGDTEPKLYGNIGSNLYWKGWNLNLNFQYRLGGHVYNQTLASRVEGADPKSNADRRVLNDRWKEPGQHALYRNIKEYKMNYISSRFVQKENMIQMTNISISYDFRNEVLRKYKLNTLRLSFYVNNPFRISTIREERGLDYPFERSFVFGLNVNF